MKKQFIGFGFLLITSIVLCSCEETKNTKYYSVNIVMDEPIPNIKENDPLPVFFQSLVNYIDTSSSPDLLVPNVTFKRIDLKSPNTINLEPPLSWINNFRKSRGMLPTQYLKEDYDKSLSEITVPKLLVEPKGKILESDSPGGFKTDEFVLNIAATNTDSIAILKDKIIKKLVGSKGNVAITIKVINSNFNQSKERTLPFDNKVLIAKADSLYNLKLLQDALKTYQEVIKLEPNNKYVIERISLIEKELTGSRVKPDHSPIEHSTTNESRTDLTANSLEEYFQKISDKNFPYDKKEILKANAIEKYFVDGNCIVSEIGNKGNEVSHKTISDLLEAMKQGNIKIEILEKKTNNSQKIISLKIKEL